MRDDVEVVLIEHHAERIAERIDHRRGDEAGTLLGHRLVRCCAVFDQPVVGGLDIVHRPVRDRAALILGRRSDVPAIEDSELMAVVADAEFDVGERPGEVLAEVRLDAEDGGVPVRAAPTSSAE